MAYERAGALPWPLNWVASIGGACHEKDMMIMMIMMMIMMVIMMTMMMAYVLPGAFAP